jgi:hypothetical protein
MNITESGTDQLNRLIWSNSSDAGALPADWDITDPGSLAGDAYLTDDRGEIIDGAQLRDYFAIYKTHSTYIMRLIGGQSVMRIDKVQVNSGLLTKNCIVEFKGRHALVSDGDIVLFDGQNVESIAEKSVRQHIFNNMDAENYTKTHIIRNDKFNEIWVCYPESGQADVNKAAVWNWSDNKWMFRDLTDCRHIASGVNIEAQKTWATLTGTWETIDTTWRETWDADSVNPTADTLMQAATLSLNVIGETYDFDGLPMATLLEKTSMDLGDPESVKIINSVVPRITADAGTIIFIRIGTQLLPDESINWSSERQFVVGTDKEAHFHEKGRYVSVRMRTEGLGTKFVCHGFYIEAKESGKY